MKKNIIKEFLGDDSTLMTGKTSITSELMENMSLIKTLLKENAESDAQKIWREYLKQNIYKSTNNLTQADASAFYDRYPADSYPQYYNGSGENISLNQEGIENAYRFTLSEKANAIKHKYYPRANDNGTSYYKQYPYIKLIAQKYTNDDIAYGSPKETEFIKSFNRFMNLYMDKHFDIIDNKTPDKLSIDEFINVYNDKYDEQKNDNSTNFTLQKGNYKVELVDTDEKARKYGKYTKWCITTGAFNNYASDTSPFYVFLREGYENEEMVKGHNYPLDSYGLSMFAILIDEEGEWKQGTTRWNHGVDNEIKGADFVVTKNIVEDLTGKSFKELCPPILTSEELEQRIKKSKIEKKGNLKFYIYNTKYYQSDDNGNLLKDKHWNYIKYDGIFDFYEGFAMCKINNKGYNWINENGEIISPNQWFNDAGNFNGGFARCKIGDKGWNWVNEKGEIFLPNQWFDVVGVFHDGFVVCKIEDKGWNWVNEKGEIFLPNQWFNSVGDFNDGFARCKIEDKGWNWVNEKGEIFLPNQWFDIVYNFKDGFAVCKIKDKGWNWVNEKGEIISPNQWFDFISKFNEGFARCEINNKGMNWVNEKGEIFLPNQWFDEVYDFNGGFAICGINNKGYNWINKNGEIILPNQWFDVVGDFKGGFATCKINNKGWNWINKNGEIISPNQWFNFVYDFNGGFAECEIGKKLYKIDTNGNIIDKELSEQIIKMKKMIKY